jgi:ubiquinone/menaquinone biosynthesis C-methylase UbiE
MDPAKCGKLRIREHLMVQYEWNEETCRRYATKMEKVVKHDHRPWAKRIAEHLGETAAGGKLMDVATGPGFLLLELAPLLSGMQLYAQDEAAPMLEIAC